MRFENQTFTSDVTLDYNEFIHCTFENCQVHYHGGPYHLVAPTFKNARFAVGSAANATLTYLKWLRSVSPQVFDELFDAAQPSPVKGATIN